MKKLFLGFLTLASAPNLIGQKELEKQVKLEDKVEYNKLQKLTFESIKNLDLDALEVAIKAGQFGPEFKIELLNKITEIKNDLNIVYNKKIKIASLAAVISVVYFFSLLAFGKNIREEGPEIVAIIILAGFGILDAATIGDALLSRSHTKEKIELLYKMSKMLTK